MSEHAESKKTDRKGTLWHIKNKEVSVSSLDHGSMSSMAKPQPPYAPRTGAYVVDLIIH